MAELQSIGGGTAEKERKCHTVKTNLGISFRDHPLCPALPVALVSWRCFSCTGGVLKVQEIILLDVYSSICLLCDKNNGSVGS